MGFRGVLPYGYVSPVLGVLLPCYRFACPVCYVPREIARQHISLQQGELSFLPFVMIGLSGACDAQSRQRWSLSCVFSLSTLKRS